MIRKKKIIDENFCNGENCGIRVVYLRIVD